MANPSPPKVAVCAILRDERRYLLEWVAYHQLIGVGSFLIFDNESADGSEILLAELKRLGVIDTVRAAGRGGPVQMAAYLAGARFLTGKADFVAFIDLDEFLVAEPNLPAALADTPADVGAIAVCQRVFGANGRERYEPEMVISRFTARAEDARSEHRWIKTIARPQCVAEFTSCHSVALTDGRYAMTDGGDHFTAAHPGEASRICHERIWLNHYMLKSREEFGWKQQRGAFSDTADHTRFSEAYFAARDPNSNAVADVSAAARAEAVRRRIKRLVESFAGEARALARADCEGRAFGAIWPNRTEPP